METRNITQYRIYVLVLNPFSRAEDGEIVAISTDYAKLVCFYTTQLSSTPTRDEYGYFHSFIEGPLYRYNPCHSLVVNDNRPFGHGIHDEWIDEYQFADITRRYLLV